MNYKNSIVFFVSILLSYILIPILLNMFLIHKCTQKNYRNEIVPISIGIIFPLNQTLICFIFSLFSNIEREIVYSYIIFLLLIALIGLLDDLIGTDQYKGFKGHISALLSGKLTTGGFKAVVGLISSVILSIIISNSLLEVIINSLIIVLFINLINLFDLRPGRALKLYIVLTISLLILTSQNNISFINYSALGIVLALFPYDIKAKGMMGDIGSNTLGMTLGFFCAESVHNNIKIFCLIGLILIHIIAEFVSISKIISNNKILNFLDRLGR